MNDCIIGIDIGGTHFRIGAVGEGGCVSDFRKLPVRQVFSTSNPMEDLISYLKSYCKDHSPKAISIGFPATLNAARTVVFQAPNVEFMQMLPIVDRLSKEFILPVFIERDVTMSLHYDCQHYGIPNSGIVCGFYFGTGIGNAISINGIPLIGKDGTAGELGHIPVDGCDLPCGCGNSGCMEAVAGGKYLMQLQKSVFPDTPISDLFAKHRQHPLLQQFLDRMAMAVATEINILNPHHILIGGGVPAMKDFPRDELVSRIFCHARKPLPANNLNILFTEDVEEKAVLGAAIHAQIQMRN